MSILVIDMKSMQQLLQSKMDRKEFFLYVGVVLLSITGISGIIHAFSDPKLLNKNTMPPKQKFGSGSYGGTKEVL